MNIEDIRQAVMIGSGTMGTGIGFCFALAGFTVALYDASKEQLKLASGRLQKSREILVREGVISSTAANEALERVRLCSDFTQAVGDAQFVLEAAPENLELKQLIFRDMESRCSPDTILATNTSGLSISQIASHCRHPERVVGMHWVNPPELVPLVEVIRGERTSAETMALVYELANKLGKKPVLIQKETPGIGLNRIQFAVLREAVHMVESGVVSADDLDRIMKYGLGFRYAWLGPLETADLGGLDVFANIAGYLFKDLCNSKETPRMLTSLVGQKRLGLKTGAGFYHYSANDQNEILRKRDTYFIRQWKLIQSVQHEGQKEGEQCEATK